MKKLSLLFVILCCTVMANAVPTGYYLNGGSLPTGHTVLNAKDSAELWGQEGDPLVDGFMYDYVEWYKVDLSDPGFHRASQPTTLASSFANKYMQTFMTAASSPWKWLGDYIIACNGTKNPNLWGTPEGAWRCAVHAFFNGLKDHKFWTESGYYCSADFTYAGKPDSWKTAYMLMKGLKPTKSGYNFMGWSKTSGGAVAYAYNDWANAKSHSDTLYAVWQPEEITYHTEGGTFSISTNEDLWDEFQGDFDIFMGCARDHDSITNNNVAGYFSTSASEGNIDRNPNGFLTNSTSSWKWLGDYIKGKLSTADLATLDAGATDNWRYTLQLFFKAIDKPTVTQTVPYSNYGERVYALGNWSTYGKPSAWLPAFKFHYGPTRVGYNFVGWYTAASGGTKVTTYASAQTHANLYAYWERKVPTALNFQRGVKITATGKVSDNVIIPVDSTHTFYVSPTPADADVSALKYTCSSGVTITQVSDTCIQVTAGRTPGAATVTVKDGSNGVTKTYNLWVAGHPAATADAPVAIYAFDLDLKYYGGEVKEYEFQFSTNTGLSEDGKIIIALKEDVDALSATPHVRYGNWESWQNLGTKYVINVPAASVPSKGTYKFRVKESVLQTTFAGKADLSTIQPDKAIVWAVQVGAGPINNFAVFRRGPITDGETGVLVSNTAPQTSNFGRLYSYFRQESGNNAYALPPVDLQGMPVTSVHEGGTWNFDRVARLAVDTKGTLYITDKGHENPGIYIGTVHDYDFTTMYVRPFFPKDQITVDISDTNSEEVNTGEGEESRHIYSIIKDKSGNEIGSAFMAMDTHVRKMSDGEMHAVIFAYAKGHSIPYCRKQYGITGKEPTLEQMKALWTDKKIIPYHCIIEYDLGPIDGTLATTFAEAKITDVLPLTGNHHREQTANIWATDKGIWVCHSRSEENNNNWAASLQFYGAGGITYTSGNTSLPVNHYINGSYGAAFAVSDDNDLLVMGDAADNLLVFDITWNGSTPTLTLKAAYHHNLGNIHQMQFDYAGNLLIGGANGVSIVSVPGATKQNRKITPAFEERYILSRHHQYDCIFAGTEDNTWSNRDNWVQGFMPDSTSDVRVSADMNIDVDNAKANSLFLVKNGENYQKFTVKEGKSLAVAGDIWWAEGGDPAAIYKGNVTATEPLITLEPKASLAYTTLTGNPTAEVDIRGTAVKDNSTWQQIAVPFHQNTAASNFYGTWLYAWDATAPGWSPITTSHAMECFQGYMLTQKQATVYGLKDKLASQSHDPQTVALSYAVDPKDANIAGYNLVGNSWVTALRVGDLDFTGANQTVYVYQKSVDKIGQYDEWPVLQDGYKDKTIAPLQAFFVRKSAATGNASVTLNYYNPAVAKDKAAAPRRAAEMEVPNISMKLDIVGEKGETDELHLFQSEKYSNAFDNGYEAIKMEGDPGTTYLAATTAIGEMAVLATPDFEGTMLNFRKATSTQYTVSFQYDEEDMWYLEDTYTNYFTEIRTGNTYFFTATDDDSQRFRIVRKPDQENIVTDIFNVWAADNHLFMENPMGEKVEVSVYAVDGSLVQQTTTQQRTIQLHVPITGVYTVKLRTNNTTQTIKCIL